MAPEVHTATAADIPALEAYGQGAMVGEWVCSPTAPAPHPEAAVLEAFLADADRFEVLVGTELGAVQAYAVMERDNHQMWWFVATPDHHGTARAVMEAAKAKYLGLWGNVENPPVRAWVASLLPTMSTDGIRVNT